MEDISQVISDSISGLEGAEPVESTESETLDTSSTEEAPEAVAEATTEPVAEETEAPAPVVQEVEDALAKELGINPKNKNNKIPYHRVQAIIKKAEEKHAAALKEREQKLQELSKFSTPEFQSYLDQSTNALKLIDENPEAFIQRLKEADPRYAKLLQVQNQQAQAQAPIVDEGEIQPDVLLPDGSLGYSAQAVQRMATQQARQVAEQVKKELEQQFGPVVQEHRQTQMMRGAVEKVKNQLAQAEQWPGFNEHKNDIHAALTSNRSLSLEQAYIQVVGPKLTASKDEIRKQVLAELNAKPRAAQGSVAPRAAKPSNAPRSIEDIIRDSIADKQ